MNMSYASRQEYLEALRTRYAKASSCSKKSQIIDKADLDKKVIGVSRFSSGNLREQLEQWSVETIAADLLERSELEKIPDVKNIIYADDELFKMLAILVDSEGIKVEPSAASGLKGPIRFEQQTDYINSYGLSEYMNQATHIVWATGGALVPDTEMAKFYEKVKGICNTKLPHNLGKSETRTSGGIVKTDSQLK